MTDSDIRAGLQALAERAGPPSMHGDDLATLVVREERSRRRRHRRVLAVAAAVALVATAVPLALHRADDRPEVTTPVLRSADIYGVPTRGSLADDAAFVEAARRQSWTASWTDDDRLPDPPVETRRVVFAGVIGNRSMALVVGENTAVNRAGDDDASSPLAAAWFVGAGTDMELYSTPRGIDEDSPIGLVGPGGNLVVVAAPGDEVEVSERPEIDADGEVSRVYRPVETADGIAVHVLDRPTSGEATSVPMWLASSFRVLRDGVHVRDAVPDTAASQVTRSIGLRMGSTRDVGHLPGVVAQDVATSTLVQLGLTDLDAEVEITTQWAGSAPGPEGTTVALVTVTVPSGAVVVAADVQLHLPGGGYIGSQCGLAIRPAGAAADDRVYAVSCPEPESGDLGSLVVVAPQEVASVRVYGAAGKFLHEYPADDGVVAVVPPPGAAEVEAVTDSGVLLGRTAFLGQTSLLAD